MRSEAEVSRAISAYADTLRRICLLHLGNRNDVEDVFQEVFLKYALHEAVFTSDDHERAWLIRVGVNACKDLRKSVWKRRVTSLDQEALQQLSLPEETHDTLNAVLQLRPPHYRDVIYLFYYEGYKATEIAQILGQKENTIYSWLKRAREQLKSTLGGDALAE